MKIMDKNDFDEEGFCRYCDILYGIAYCGKEGSPCPYQDGKLPVPNLEIEPHTCKIDGRIPKEGLAELIKF